MARQLNMDTQRQNFWKEEYLKEMLLRFAWHKKYGAAIKAKQERQHLRKAKEAHLKLPAIQPPAPEKPPAAPQPPAPAPKAPPAEPTLALGAEMRPVPPDVQELLYRGISHEHEGRWRYLQTRTLAVPEEKYIFPITTNFIYGWQMGKMTKVYVPPGPKCCIDSFYRKNGAFSMVDPSNVAL
uniref:Sperm microtubule inner protein 1 n=1 Tax=Sphenodon punctatus TaxID=8508 RepID=A0A8D0GJH0_SPHPU